MADLASGGLTTQERRAVDAIDRDEIIGLLHALVAVPSVSGADAECDIQDLLAGRLRGLGLDVDHWRLDLDTLTAEPTFPGWEVPRTESWGLAARTSGDGDPALVLQGHVDVVPPGDLGLWSGAPFTPVFDGEMVIGRGTCDMKGGVVANVAAIAAIVKSGAVLPRPLGIHCVVGEEDGGLGAYATLARGHRAQACIITEPTDETLITASAGALTFELLIEGRSAHGSTAYVGHSAIDAYWPVHRAVQQLQRRRNASVDLLMREYPVAYPISIGTLRAGDWASTVPDLLVAEGRLGVALDEDPADARTALEQAIAAIEDPWLREHPVRVRWSGGQFAPGRVIPGSDLVAAIGTAHADTHGTPRPRERGGPYGSDLRLYSAAGIPTIHYGPGDVRVAHAPNEAVSIAQVERCTQTLVVAALRTSAAT